MTREAARAANAAARAWAESDTGAAVTACVSPDTLRALREVYRLTRPAGYADPLRRGLRGAVAAVRTAARAVERGAVLAGAGDAPATLTLTLGEWSVTLGGPDQRDPVIVLAGAPDANGEPCAAVFAGGLPRMLARTAVDADGLSALALVHRRAAVAVTPYRPVNRANLPDLTRRTRELPDLPTLPAERGTLWLPGLEPTADACPSWLLSLWDRAGGQSLAQGRGAPWALRLWIGALLHVAVRDRTGRPVTLPFRVRDVAAWLHPDGWRNRWRDWKRLPAALDSLGSLRVPLPVVGPAGRETTGMVALVSAPVVPRDWRDGNAPVYLDVRIPPEGAAGSRLDWPTLCRYGADSAGLYRAYLAVTAWMHRTAYRGAPITRQISDTLRLLRCWVS